jgi:hypothetical protein
MTTIWIMSAGGAAGSLNGLRMVWALLGSLADNEPAADEYVDDPRKSRKHSRARATTDGADKSKPQRAAGQASAICASSTAGGIAT